MSPADEWSTFVLQTASGRLVSLARHIPNPEAGVPPTATRPYQKGDDPFAPLLDAMAVVDGEHCDLHNRLLRLEEAGTVTPAPQLPRDTDPLGPLFDALESINGELTGFAARLARLEDTVFQAQFLPRPPRLVNSPSATVRAARGRLVRRAVSRA
ncbi:hypothetical protein K388_05987 [Streptomyces sp. KhCrAH-43]|uniref:hypothetical protein n=1 Tax=unclassified Streptomyces TaxID=2593676 RepID=UPI00037C7740|nr:MULTISPECIES: hypothetical protein [unclassified Streptomyces]MYS33645.1 hypothetical protein [Streptomyces sp. SID4920]MYX63762.1 hypothetical protein [Streptomyces sp. SID8373]RAJ52887.1 hypothetical protein K388_05987 [Streptomyces sp. KhCrAH-43]